MTLSRRRFVQAAGLGCAGAAALPGCVTTNVATGRTSFTGGYDIEDDIRIGREEHPKMVEAFGGEYADPRLQRYVTRIGEKLAAHAEYQQFPYTFTLLNSPIVNAFAMPGGFVYVSRGLLALASNEAELAGVVAHELGHVTARHSAERLAAQQLATFGVIAGAIGAAALGLPSGVADVGQTIAGLAIQGYSRSQELESDRLGVRYMTMAGYDPDAMASFLGTLREQSQLEARALGLPPGSVDEYNMMSTHPRTVDRVREAQAAAAAQRPASAIVGRQEYLAHIDGMLYGDDPSQGMAIGRRFVHPELGFEFTAPEGFRIQNDPSRVVAHDAQGAAVIFDFGPIRRARDMASYVQHEWAPNVNLQDLERLTVNGLEGATGRTATRGASGVTDLRLVAVRRDRSAAYRFVFVSPRSRTNALADAFERTAFSLRRLTPEEAAAVKPLRLAVVPARAGESVASYARGLPYGELNDAWFRVLNDLAPGEEPRGGRPLKVVST